ncbi:MAG: cytochrome c [Sphingomicrobium sp.]
MRNALLAATASALMLAGCNQSPDKSAAEANVPSGQVLPITDVNASMVAVPPMEAMMQSMRGRPMAHDAAMRRMHERHEGMEQIGKSFKLAGRSLKSQPSDLTVVRSAAATIAMLAAKTPTWFPAGTGPDIGKTGAKPEIWQKPADFVARDRAFQQAAAAFNIAAKSGNMAAIQARFSDLGKTCKSCHDAFRNEMHH